MRITLVQFGSASDDVTANVERAAELVRRAIDRDGPDLVILPEFFNTPYFAQYPTIARYWGLAEPEDGPSLTAMRELARETGTAMIVPIYEDAAPGIQYDSAFLVDATGAVVGRYRKTHAPAIEGGYEKLYYRPGSELPVLRLGEWAIGLLICYDWRFPEAARSLAASGADLIVLPFATPPMRMWHEGMRTRAWENQVYLAVCNRVGQDGNWTFSGSSMIIDPYGEVLAEASDRDEDAISATLELARIRAARLDDFNWRDRRPEIYGALTTEAGRTV